MCDVKLDSHIDSMKSFEVFSNSSNAYTMEKFTDRVSKLFLHVRHQYFLVNLKYSLYTYFVLFIKVIGWNMTFTISLKFWSIPLRISGKSELFVYVSNMVYVYCKLYNNLIYNYYIVLWYFDIWRKLPCLVFTILFFLNMSPQICIFWCECYRKIIIRLWICLPFYKWYNCLNFIFHIQLQCLWVSEFSYSTVGYVSEISVPCQNHF